MRRFNFFLLAMALCALPAMAQNFGEITGTISDSTAASMAGALVTVTNTATSQSRQVSTNDTGNYSLTYLVPGIYDIRAENPGFKASSRKAVGLDVGATLRIDFKLEVGDASQQIEITSAAPLLTTETTALGTVIDNRRIVDLPLNGRDYLQLVTLSPNVSTEGGAGGSQKPLRRNIVTVKRGFVGMARMGQKWHVFRSANLERSVKIKEGAGTSCLLCCKVFL